MLSETTEKRVISFVRTVANDCARCLRRTEENCDNCRSLWANSIMKDIELDNEGKSNYADYSFASRMANIMIIIKTANRPLMSKEIDLKGACSFQLKLWTLKQMVKKGIICRRVAKRSSRKNYYFYFLKSARETKNENHNA